MKKNNLDKILSLVMCVCMLICILEAVNVNAAVVNPEQVTNVSLTRRSGTELSLEWNEADGASGYAVYMKTNKGAYQLIKSTKSTSLKKKGLTIGNSYCFKVRAYKKVKGKKVYGKYSDVIKKKMTDYEYLVEVMEPYASSDIRKYAGINSLNLYDNEYYYSISTGEGWANSYRTHGYANYNLKGHYSKIDFLYCSYYEEDEGKALVYADDELIETLTTEPNVLPKTMSINVEDVYILKLELDHCALLGVKLYY